jgi:hypothetical protein
VSTPHDATRSFSPLDAVIAGYLHAVEAGMVPDRQDLLGRHGPGIANGQKPTLVGERWFRCAL